MFHTSRSLPRRVLRRFALAPIALVAVLLTPVAARAGDGDITVIRVLDETSGRPIEGARVRLFLPNGTRLSSGTTDSAGLCLHPLPDAGRVRVLVDKGGYLPRGLEDRARGLVVDEDLDESPVPIELTPLVSPLIVVDEVDDGRRVREIGGQLSPGQGRRLKERLTEAQQQDPEVTVDLDFLGYNYAIQSVLTATLSRHQTEAGHNREEVDDDVATVQPRGVVTPRDAGEGFAVVSGVAGGAPGLTVAEFSFAAELLAFDFRKLLGFSASDVDVLDRGTQANAFFYDYEKNRFHEVDPWGDPVHDGWKPAGYGNVIPSIFGGRQIRGVELADGGVLTIEQRAMGPRPRFGEFDCKTRQAKTFASTWGEGGLVRQIQLGGPETLDVGHGCFPVQTQQVSIAEIDRHLAAAYVKETRLQLAVVAMLFDPVIAAVFDLGELPAELEEVFFWQPALAGDETSGGLVVDMPFGDDREFATDAFLLGFAPWILNDVTLSFESWFTGQLLVHAIVFDILQRAWKLGLFEEDDPLLRPDAPRSKPVDPAAVEAPGGVPQNLAMAQVPLAGCFDTDDVFCAHHNRFAISATYRTPQGESGQAHARPLSNDSGTFWFFDRDNRELIVKVVNACGFGGNFWFFAAGLTNVEVELEIWDRVTGETRRYRNPQGRLFEPVLDTAALPCNASAEAQRWEAASRRAAERTAAERENRPVAQRRAGATDGTACGGRPEDLCLADGRFRVEADFTDFQGGTGRAFGGNLTDDTGALFFFDPANVEMLVKVLDVCFLGNYWVFAAGLTNLEVELRVIDTVTGQREVFRNPLGTDLASIADTVTFGCTPS